jgi:hypothetical protein
MMHKNFDHDFFADDLYSGSHSTTGITESNFITKEKTPQGVQKAPPTYFNQTEQVIFQSLATKVSEAFEREYRKETPIDFPALYNTIRPNTTKLTIDSSLFSKGYFEITKDSVQLRPDTLKKTSEVRDTDKYLEKHSEIKDIEKVGHAPIKLTKKQKQAAKKDTLVKWGGMEAPILTPELTQEIEAIKLRNTSVGIAKGNLNDTEEMPKYFQIGTVMAGPTEFFHQRKRKDRKNTFLDELIYDQKQSNYINERYKKIKK